MLSARSSASRNGLDACAGREARRPSPPPDIAPSGRCVATASCSGRAPRRRTAGPAPATAERAQRHRQVRAVAASSRGGAAPPWVSTPRQRTRCTAASAIRPQHTATQRPTHSPRRKVMDRDAHGANLPRFVDPRSWLVHRARFLLRYPPNATRNYGRNQTRNYARNYEARNYEARNYEASSHQGRAVQCRRSCRRVRRNSAPTSASGGM